MQNAPRSGAFLLGKFFCAQNFNQCAKISKRCARPRAKIKKILRKNIKALRKKAAVKSSSLNLNVAHQNFEVKIFLNQRRQSAHLFAGSHAVQSHISYVLLLRPRVH